MGTAAAISCDVCCLLGLTLEAALPDRQSVFWRSDGLGDELAASAFVNGKLTIGIDLTLEDVENAGTRCNRFQLRVAGASEEAIGLKLIERMEPFLTVIIDHIFVVPDGNTEVLQSSADGVSDGLGVVGHNVSS